MAMFGSLGGGGGYDMPEGYVAGRLDGPPELRKLKMEGDAVVVRRTCRALPSAAAAHRPVCPRTAPRSLRCCRSPCGHRLTKRLLLLGGCAQVEVAEGGVGVSCTDDLLVGGATDALRRACSLFALRSLTHA